MVEQVGVNVLKCVRACGARTAVALGAAGPLEGHEAPRASHFHGLDGLGDATPKLEAALEWGAVPKLLEVLREGKERRTEVTVVTLGGA